MKKNNTFYLWATVTVMIVMFLGCGSKSDEEIILDTLKTVGKYAEERDVERILDYLSPDYHDSRDRRAEDIVPLLEKYTQYRGIAINILSTNILSLQPPQAEIETEVALSSGAAKFFRKAVSYSGRYYRFTLKLEKTDPNWQVIAADWNSVTLEELFPESMKILKKLFPDL